MPMSLFVATTMTTSVTRSAVADELAVCAFLGGILIGGLA